MAQQKQTGQTAAGRAPGARMQIDPNVQRCIDESLHCHSVCLSTASQQCLEQGGEHVEPGHYRLMLACAEICRSTAAMMMIGSDFDRRLCAVCAEICAACAKSCEEIGGMRRCVEACRNCADTCRQMTA
jgi:hypothetical protein